MKRSPIPFEHFCADIFAALNNRWMLLTAGGKDAGTYNIMTISWGAVGVLWNKPIAVVFVRPSRHTYGFMEGGHTFTLCAFPSEFKDSLTLCGTSSGRTIDKIKECGFTPVPSSLVSTPGFDEAELILECRKIYYDDIKPAHFLAPYIEGNYKGHDYHRLYIGEIAAIQGTSDYRKN